MNAKMSNLSSFHADKVICLDSFCTIEEALEYAEKKLDPYGGRHVWMAIFGRRDFQKLIRKDLSVDEAIKLAQRIENRCVWYDEVSNVVMGREDTKKFLLETLSPIKAIIYGIRSHCDWIWRVVKEREDVKTYLTTIPLDKALSCAKKFSNIDIWAIFLTRSDLTPPEAIGLGISAPYDNKLWEYTLFKRDDVRKHLLEMPLDELLPYLAKVNYWRVWGFIFDERKDLPFKEIVLLYKEATVNNKPEGYGIGLYIHHIICSKTRSKEEVIALAKEVDYYKVWECLFVRSDFSKEEAISMAQEENTIEAWKGALLREDVSMVQAISYAEKLNNDKIWKIVSGKTK